MFQNIPADKILEVVKKGPTIPSKISKEVGGDTLIVGAILSTLIENKQICVSHLKIGGSPIYYVPEDKHKLEEFINYLNEKDRKVFHILKDKKFLKDSEQDPLMRVALSGLVDFAKTVQFNNEKFWLFYNVDESEINNIPKEQSKIISEPDSNSKKVESESKIETLKESIKQVKEDTSEVEETTKKDFLASVKERLHKKNLDIISIEKIKKTEYVLILKNHNEDKYIYCKAKDKKTLNEGDIAPAVIFAQNKNMPCLFLSSGKLSKKSEAAIHKEFKNLEIEFL